MCDSREEYFIPSASVKYFKRINDGIVSGLLAVPFKYHFADHAVTAGTTIGAYIGYENEWYPIGSAALIVGGGLALVPTYTTITNFASLPGGT